MAALTRIPGVRGGRVVVRGTTVTAESLAEYFAAGMSIVAIAAEMNIDQCAVASAVRAVMASAFCRQGLRANVRRALEKMVTPEGKPWK